jgi:hypothetical protein
MRRSRFATRLLAQRALVLLVAVTGIAGVISARPVQAAPVRGVIALSQDLKTGRKFRGYWRLENGMVPLGAPASRNDTFVVLNGVKGQAPAPRTVTIDISGYQAVPSTIVVGEGSVVEFKNSDRVPHDLSIPDQITLMPVERLAPGAIRRQKFMTAGGYAIRSLDYPHLVISVLVVGSQFFAPVDEKGAFKLPDAPDGRATLKVWSQGKWVHEEAIEVGPKSSDLRLKVPERVTKTAAGSDTD